MRVRVLQRDEVTRLGRHPLVQARVDHQLGQRTADRRHRDLPSLAPAGGGGVITSGGRGAGAQERLVAGEEVGGEAVVRRPVFAAQVEEGVAPG